LFAYLLLIISLTAKILYKILENFSGKRFLKSAGDFYFFNFIRTIICFILFAGLALRNGISMFSLLLGIVFGVITMLNNTYSLLAFSKGPMNLTDLIITSSMLIPTISGAVFFQEAFSVPKIIITVFLIFFIQLSVKNTDNGAGINQSWLICCLITFMTQGAIGVLQKFHQASVYKDELSGFLAVAFFVSMCGSFLVSSGQKSEQKSKFKPKHYMIALIGGICLFAMNYLNLKLSGMLPSQLFFPLSAGSGAIIIQFVSYFVFHETLTTKQMIGIIGGIISLICLCMF